MKRFAFFVIALFLLAATPLWAHPGRLDRNGCHTNHKTGDYHCHGKAGKGEGCAVLTGEACERSKAAKAAHAKRQKVFEEMAARRVTAQVDEVLDGDTINVIADDGKSIRIRLYGFDCPENGQDFGDEAQAEMSRLVAGKTVAIIPMDTDRYGRTVAQVFTTDGVATAKEMLVGGFAWYFDKYCTQEDICPLYLKWQNEAKNAGRGLWANDNAISPSEWRKQNK